MISNINDLPFELLVHTFSFLPSSELVNLHIINIYFISFKINIGRICKKWAELVRDDHIWEEAFLKNWGRAPDMYIQHVYDLMIETNISKTYSRLDGRSWKQEYLARSRLIMYQLQSYPNITILIAHFKGLGELERGKECIATWSRLKMLEQAIFGRLKMEN